MTESPAPVEYLYGVDTNAGDDGPARSPRVVQFRITKKTPKRIYYVRSLWGPRSEIGYVDRQEIETTGQARRKSAGWWEPDFTVYLTPPEITQQPSRPNLDELKAAMAAAHPDRGGSHEGFIAARRRYEEARNATKAVAP